MTGIVSFTIFLVIVSVSNVSAETGDTLWTRTYGGSNDDIGVSVRQIMDDGYIITGYTYYIVIDGYSTASGNNQLNIGFVESCDPIPPNDECINAELITSPYPVTINGSTICSTTVSSVVAICLITIFAPLAYYFWH